ncbi:hypothetical protein [Acinetobacter chinensis]|uniref:hypothetical protein n=1 Tax=Acinetobacter chinensis TaxID=2004650 RepID=UPI002934D808|nr:hypothetical protein [Acinetobacter chinensis]WOE40672.1 hypothetical protein QSG87_12360 [Acinetobacter chinensis]
MSRLTKQLREAMLETMLSHAFDTKQKSAAQMKTAAGEKIYQDIFGSSLIAMESLPNGFLPQARCFYIAIAGQVHLISLSEYRLIGGSHGDKYGNKAKLYVGDEPVAVDFQQAIDLSDLALSVGDARYNKAKELLAESLLINEWDGYSQEMEELYLPSYMTKQALENDFN